MTFAQRRNRLTTHFSERIPVVKRRKTEYAHQRQGAAPDVTCNAASYQQVSPLHTRYCAPTQQGNPRWMQPDFLLLIGCHTAPRPSKAIWRLHCLLVIYCRWQKQSLKERKYTHKCCRLRCQRDQSSTLASSWEVRGSNLTSQTDYPNCLYKNGRR